MKLAFYAPLKPADHPTPSGDRAMARAVISALKDGGHTVDVASALRSFEPRGEADAQKALIAQAETEVLRLTALGQQAGWGAWITYHTYYKAPDLIGPHVARALGIPYLLIEATRAKKRLGGPWDTFAKAAEAGCDAADAIFYLTERDAQALHRDAPEGQILIHLRPFLDRAELPVASDHSGTMLSVGMMRHGDKLASYTLIAQTLALLPEHMRQIDLVGDGAAMDEVRALFAPFAKTTTFHGALSAAEVDDLYARAKLLFWPGVNEAFGLTYLEAQAAGVPVVAQDRPGVRDVTYGAQPAIKDGANAMAEAIVQLHDNPDQRIALGIAARANVQQHHLRNAATNTINDTLIAVTGTPA